MYCISIVEMDTEDKALSQTKVWFVSGFTARFRADGPRLESANAILAPYATHGETWYSSFLKAVQAECF
jgi:hypothetical protein